MALGPQSRQVNELMEAQVKQIEKQMDAAIEAAARLGAISPVSIVLQAVPGVAVQKLLRDLYTEEGWTQVLFRGPMDQRDDPTMILHM